MAVAVAHPAEHGTADAEVTVRPLTCAAGAEISGIDLRDPLSDPNRRVILDALRDRGVVFIPGQAITPAQQVAFARAFGHVPNVPDSMFRVHPEQPCVSVLENDADRPPTVNTWHSDYSFAARPDYLSVLWSKSVPAFGGDTIWVNMVAAYDGLPERMQRMVEGLFATHDFMYLYERPFKKFLWEGERYDYMEAARLEHPPVSHPVVRTIPETGQKALFINESFTRHIDGVRENESRSILGYLIEHIKTPEFQVRYRWSAQTLAVWDNRTTAHYAVADYHPAHRLMHRVTVLNDEVPV